MKEFINNLKYEIINCMTEDDKEFIDLEDRYYVEFGEDATYEDIEKIIESLEKNFKVPSKFSSVASIVNIFISS